jgi:hypothetical protein
MRVPGVAQAPLDDARLARLLDWVVSEFANARPEPFAPEDVARLRRSPLRDPEAARRRALASPPRGSLTGD